MRTREEQTINNLIHTLDMTLAIGDFNSNDEMIGYVVNKIDVTREDLSNYGYKTALCIADNIKVRVRRLKGTRKAHNIPTRIKDILSSQHY